jgi:acyl carrier protein
VLEEHAQLGAALRGLSDEGDLYEAGMTSRASVNVMLGLESEFDIEFPDNMLRRDVFESVAAISNAVAQLTNGAA